MREACVTIPAPLMANMSDGGRTPIGPVRELSEIGYACAIWPALAALAASAAIESALQHLKESGTSSVWAEDKLYQIVNHRYYAHLPTVITSTLKPDSFAVNYPGRWNKILDATKSQSHVIDMPPYRRMAKGKSVGHRKGK